MNDAIVGPLQTVVFRGGPWPNPDPTTVVYTPPRDTMDPRYVACTEHRVACDCREAEWAEWRQEIRYAENELRAAITEVLAGHPTRQWSDDGNTFTGCMCTGCQIVRAADLYVLEA